MVLCDSPTHLVQQSTAGASAHVGFEILAHSRRRIDEKHVDSVILDEDPSMPVLMSVLRSHVLDDNDEVVHRHKVPGFSSDRKSEFLPQLGLYVLGRSLDLANGGRARVDRGTNKVDGFGYFRRDLVVPGPTLPTSAEVCPFLKHGRHGRLLLPGTAAAHDTLHEVFCRLPIVRYGFRVSSLVPI